MDSGMSERERIGRLIRGFRDERDWNQEDLAKQIGVKPITIHRWEHGKSDISDKNRRTLARIFNVSPAELGQEGEQGEVPPSRLNREAVIKVWLAHTESAYSQLIKTTDVLQTTLESLRDMVEGLQDQTRIVRERLASWSVSPPDLSETEALEELFNRVKREEELRAARRMAAAYRRAQKLLGEQEARGESTENGEKRAS